MSQIFPKSYDFSMFFCLIIYDSWCRQLSDGQFNQSIKIFYLEYSQTKILKTITSWFPYLIRHTVFSRKLIYYIQMCKRWYLKQENYYQQLITSLGYAWTLYWVVWAHPLQNWVRSMDDNAFLNLKISDLDTMASGSIFQIGAVLLIKKYLWQFNLECWILILNPCPRVLLQLNEKKNNDASISTRLLIILYKRVKSAFILLISRDSKPSLESLVW